MNVISRELTNGHETSPSVTVVTGRHDRSRSGRSADIFTPSITPPWIFSKSIAELTNGHQTSSSVAVVTGCRDPSRSGRSADILTTHHNTAKNIFKVHREPHVTIRHVTFEHAQTVKWPPSRLANTLKHEDLQEKCHFLKIKNLKPLNTCNLSPDECEVQGHYTMEYFLT